MHQKRDHSFSGKKEKGQSAKGPISSTSSNHPAQVKKQEVKHPKG